MRSDSIAADRLLHSFAASIVLAGATLAVFAFVWGPGPLLVLILGIALVLGAPGFLATALPVTLGFAVAGPWVQPLVSAWMTPPTAGPLLALALLAAIFGLRRRLLHPRLIAAIHNHPTRRRVIETLLVGSLAGAVVTLTLRAFPLLPHAALLAIVSAMWIELRRSLPKNPRTISTTVATGATLGISIVAGLVIVEVGTRTVIFPDGGWRDIREPHPEYLWLYRPNSSNSFLIQKSPDARERIHVEISREGVRDDHFGSKNADEIRVALLGDSFTYGHVQKGDTLDAHLEAELADAIPDRTVKVINGGLGGSGPWQHRGLLLERILPLEPDVVIHQLFLANDLADTLERDPQFLRAYKEQRMRVVVARRRQALVTRFFIENWLANHLSSYRAFRQRVGRKTVERFLMDGCRLLPRYDERPIPPSLGRLAEFEPSLVETYPLLEEAWNRLLDDIDAIRNECVSRSIPYTVYVIPPRQMVWDDEWETYSKLGEYQRGLAHRRLRQRLRERNISHFDVYNPLLNHPKKHSLYYEIDGHLNPKGNEIVAGLIAEYLARSGLLEHANGAADSD